jgi:mRNA deadenylase 3'-5' endonuclease subunit Ccr4
MSSFSVRSYNVLAQGFFSPFEYYTPASLHSFSSRRAASLRAIIDAKPSIIGLQEVQSTTRGWGRLVQGADDDDHAQWYRLQLAAVGYQGAYLPFEDCPKSSRSRPANDAPPADGKSGAWPVKTIKSANGGRIGLALFWDESKFEQVCSRNVSFSSHFLKRTKDLGNEQGWLLLSSWTGALISILKHLPTGALLCVANTHLPTPREEEGGEDEAGPAKEASKGQVQQVQFAESLCREITSLLNDLGFLHKIPTIILGDFNSKPSSPVYELLTTGALPVPSPCLHPRLRDGSPITLPYPAPSCGQLGAFSSAYAMAQGTEPSFTNFRRVRRSTKSTAENGEVTETFEELPPFCACLDYIFSTSPSPPAALSEIKLERVAPLPISAKPLPNDEHPSDHVGLTAYFS